MRPAVVPSSRVDENALGKIEVLRKRGDVNRGISAFAVPVIEKGAGFPSVVKELVKLSFTHHAFIRSLVKLRVKNQFIFARGKILELVEWLVKLLPKNEEVMPIPSDSSILTLSATNIVIRSAAIEFIIASFA